jgi:hypothetical protein
MYFSKCMRPAAAPAPHSVESTLPNAEFTRKLSLRKPKSGDLRLAREVDFDECCSPQPCAPFVEGSCLAYGRDAAGRPQRMEPADAQVCVISGFRVFQPMAQLHRASFARSSRYELIMFPLQVNQYAPMSPMLAAAREGEAAGAFRSPRRHSGEGGSGEVSPRHEGARSGVQCDPPPPGLDPLAAAHTVVRSLQLGPLRP